MKKKLFGAALAAFFSAAMVMGSFAGELTAEEIMEKSKAASESLNEVSATVDGKADVTLAFPDQNMTLGVTGSMGMYVAATLDPLAALVEASMTGDMMGQSGSMDMEIYMVPEDDGSLYVYAGMDQGEGLEWMLTSIDAKTVSQYTDMLKGGKAMSDLPISFTLADGTVDVNGTECYSLVASLGWEDIMNLYKAALEVAGDAVPAESIPDEETLASVGALLGGLVVNFEMDVDTEKYLVQKLHIDLNGSDWVTLGATIAAMMGMTDDSGNLLSVSLDVNALYLDYYYDYGTPVSIEVPQDVVDNATNVGSATDLTEMAATMVEEAQSES